MRLSTFRWKKRTLRREHEDDIEAGGGELSLVPYLDIVTNIILFLMMTTTFTAALSSVAVAAPAHCEGERCAAPAPGLSLVVHVSRAGFTLATADSVRPLLAADAGRLDFAALGREAAALKAAHPAETHVVVSANPDIDYETVIAATDALRGTPDHPLFPDVSLAAGVE